MNTPFVGFGLFAFAISTTFADFTLLKMDRTVRARGVVNDNADPQLFTTAEKGRMSYTVKSRAAIPESSIVSGASQGSNIEVWDSPVTNRPERIQVTATGSSFAIRSLQARVNPPIRFEYDGENGSERLYARRPGNSLSHVRRYYSFRRTLVRKRLF